LTRTIALALAAAALFATLATLNAGGYQYGAGDQAFYLPAIYHHLDPGLFPRDWPLLAMQDRFNVVTAALAAASRSTGVSLPALFFVAHLATLAILFWAVVALGRSLYRSWWTVAALACALTLRHRVAESGVNTLESYMHPRMLAFAIGSAAVAMFLRGWSWAALVVAGTAGLVHPTTGVWFAAWLVVAVLVSDRRARVPVATAVAVLGAGLAWWAARSGRLAGALGVMDADWLSVLTARPYLFPSQWHTWAWALALAYPVLIVIGFRSRARAGVALPRERGLVIGAVALFAGLVASLPVISGHHAFAVALQVPRVLWLLELLATVYVAWWLVERPTREPARSGLPPSRRVIVAALFVVAAARGSYVMFVEHAGRPVVRIDLRDDEWRDAMQWLGRTPPATHVLADPGHAWRYGSSVRVAAARDVFHEDLKDGALALYSRDTATRVLGRTRDLGDFGALTADHARALAAKYDLDYLVAEQPFDLPVAYRNSRFTVYALK
jgi:hypothetical protein